MKCSHCNSEWTTTANNQRATCPFCGKALSVTAVAKSSFDVDAFFDKKLEEVKKTDSSFAKQVTAPKTVTTSTVAKGVVTPGADRASGKTDWAVALGYKPGSEPWKIGLDLTGRAEAKLVAKIATVTDQELVRFLIAKTNNANVKCAATKKLTDQRLLERLAFEEEHAQVRKTAAENLTGSTQKKRILVAAAEISQKLTLCRFVFFNDLLQTVSQNRDLVKRLASEYPCEHVRYLAQQIMGSPETFTSVEEQLRFQTPPKEILHCREMESLANSAADSFLTLCQWRARAGERSLKKWYDGCSFTSFEDAADVAGVTKARLRKSGFSSAEVNVVWETGAYYITMKAFW